MGTAEIIHTIDAGITRLEQVSALLNGGRSTTGRGLPVSLKPAATLEKPQRKKMSAAGRTRIAAAQKARLAKAKA